MSVEVLTKDVTSIDTVRGVLAAAALDARERRITRRRRPSEARAGGRFEPADVVPEPRIRDGAGAPRREALGTDREADSNVPPAYENSVWGSACGSRCRMSAIRQRPDQEHA